MTPEAVLRTFARLAASRETTSRTDVVHQPNLFVLQRYTAARILTPLGLGADPSAPVAPMPGNHERVAERLLAAAELHRTEQLLRAGWVWFAGTVERDGEPVRYCFPAISAPVARRGRVSRVMTALGGGNVTAAALTLRRVGDVEVTDLIDDPELRTRLLHGAEFGGGALVDGFDPYSSRYTAVDPRLLPRLTRLRQWYRSVADGVGVRINDEFLVQEANPVHRKGSPGVAVIVACALYLDRPPAAGTRRETLLTAASVGGLDRTALGRIYGSADDGDEPDEAAATADVVPLRPMSERQRFIVERLAPEPAAVISGAPGTGKSHVLTVTALDAVARGQSVLVAAGSPYAVDVLVEHFAEAPGPTPVAFGGSTHGTQLAHELAELASRHSGGELRLSDAATQAELEQSIRRLLDTESEARRLGDNPARWLDLTESLERAGNLFELDELIHAMKRRGPTGWWARRRHEAGVVRRLAMDPPTAGPTEMADRLERLRRGAAARRLLMEGGLSLTGSLDEMVANEARAAKQHGDRVVHQWLNSLNRRHRRTLGSLANAIAQSRAARRTLLAGIDPRILTEAAPLWVGSVRDVDEVLPLRPGLFDLLILDEASQIDQLAAASALIRARRVVICGDPHQLGHVSFFSDEAIEEAAAEQGVDANLVNPRRLSIFDMAAGRSPLHVLDEHYRSAPHLIEFSARRIYRSQLHLATRRPANEAADHIHIDVVAGRRSRSKINQAEVEACLEIGQGYIGQGWRSIGFITPFRAQADALEDALLDRYRLEEIEHYGLRVGTVHSFQGDERDVIVASWAVGPDEGAGPWRFVNQRNLFNVMVTRAREQMHVVTSVADPPGLAGEYLQWSEPLTNLVTDLGSTDPWIEVVAAVAAENDVPARTGYRVGRHTVDVVIGTGGQAVAVDCVPHPDGPAAHIDRAMMLRRAGWRTFDAFQSRWGDHPGGLGVELKALVADGPAG